MSIFGVLKESGGFRAVLSGAYSDGRAGVDDRSPRIRRKIVCAKKNGCKEGRCRTIAEGGNVES